MFDYMTTCFGFFADTQHLQPATLSRVGCTATDWADISQLVALVWCGMGAFVSFFVGLV